MNGFRRASCVSTHDAVPRCLEAKWPLPWFGIAMNCYRLDPETCLGKLQIISVLVPTTCPQTFSMLPLHVHLHIEQEHLQNIWVLHGFISVQEGSALRPIDNSKESQCIAILSMFRPFGPLFGSNRV